MTPSADQAGGRLSLWRGRIPPYREIDRSVTMRDMAARIAGERGLSLEEIRGPSRTHRVSAVRQEAFSACSALGHSTPRIGAFFGGRDHTTVLHGIRRYRARVAG